MSGKIDRLASAARPKVERAQVETPTKTAAVSRVPAAVATAFTEGGPAGLGDGANGEHLAISARPDTLWGAAPREPSLDRHQFDQLTPAQRSEKLEQLQAEQAALQAQILTRVAQLDSRWERAPIATREQALRHYAEHGQHLSGRGRGEVWRLLRQSEGAQRRIDRLSAKRDGMPPARNASAETRRKRDELNKELRAARQERKDAVVEATAVVDAEGLKVDRLAVTEQVINPSAPKPDSASSLLGMVANFFKFSWLTNWLMTAIIDLTDKSSIKDVHEAQLARQLADHQAHLKKVEDLEALKKLSAAAELARG